MENTQQISVNGTKLKNFVDTITSTTILGKNINQEIKNIEKVFNDNWVTGSAEALRLEINSCFKNYIDTLSDNIAQLSSDISDIVTFHNEKYEENIEFNGFSYSKDFEQLSTFDSHITGGSEGDTINPNLVKTDFTNAFTEATSAIETIINNFESAYNENDAFETPDGLGDTEIDKSIKNFIKEMREALSTGLTKLKESFETRLEQDLL